MKEIEARVAGLLAVDHVLQYGPAVGQICKCGFRRPADPELMMTEQEKHAVHVAAMLAEAGLLADGQIGGQTWLRDRAARIENGAGA